MYSAAVKAGRQVKSRAAANAVEQQKSEPQNAVDGVKGFPSAEPQPGIQHPAASNAGVCQMELKEFKKDWDTSKTIPETAEDIDKVTDIAFKKTVDEINAVLSKAKTIDNADFPGASDKRKLAWYKTMGGNSESLKAAATGYLIEDYVTAATGSWKGVESQVTDSGGRPDFVVYDGSQKGVVDLTSTKQVGHVMKKDFNKGHYKYISESLYDRLDFSKAQIDVDMTMIKSGSLHKQLILNADAHIGDRITTLAKNCGLIATTLRMNRDSNAKYFEVISKELRKRRLTKNSFWQIKKKRQELDDMMEELHNKYGGIFGGLPGPTEIIDAILADYGVTYAELKIVD